MEARTMEFGDGKLGLRVFFSDETSFAVASVIVYGERDCVVLDTQWTRANAYRVCAEICELGKNLTTIFVSHAHPDHYFGTAYIAEQFPGAKCVAPAPAAHTINTQFYDKIDHWTQVIGWQNVCTKSVEIQPVEDNVIMLEGERIEIFPNCMGDLRYNSLVWIPSIKAVYGSDILFNEAHPFTCELSKRERELWMADIDFIESLKPEVVIPGHQLPGMPFDWSTLKFMREYLLATEEALQTTQDEGSFFLMMCRKFPRANLVMLSNEMNAAVHKGGREWDWRDEEDTDRVSRT